MVDGRRRGGAMMMTTAVVSAFRVMVVCCYCWAAAVTIPEAVHDDGGGGDAGRTAVKRSDPMCPDDGCAGIRCPGDRDACPLGLVPDGCACCPYGVCGLGEARECDTAGRPCADQLECVKMEPGGDDDYGVDRAASKLTYRCACKVQEPVCGSDNRTYSNVCQLNEAVAVTTSSGSGDNGTTTTLWMQYLGPCQSAPIIQSVPKNYDSSIGQPVVFDCEVKGYPVPSISWRFTDIQGITKWLPGDDTLMAIQTRGGPDRLTVTSWVQIMEFKPHHIGNYTCLGTNLVDTATASGVLNIRKMS